MWWWMWGAYIRRASIVAQECQKESQVKKNMAEGEREENE